LFKTDALTELNEAALTTWEEMTGNIQDSRWGEKVVLLNVIFSDSENF